MKTARITFLGTDELKARLEAEAAAENISVGELIRRQFEQRPPSEDEQLLSALAEELIRSAAETRQAMSEALTELDTTLRYFAEQRKHHREAA